MAIGFRTTVRRRSSALPFALVPILLGAVPAARAEQPAEIGPSAVWNPPADFFPAFRASCGELGGSAFTDCFVAEMAKAGASAPAVAFARRTGGMGYLRAFRDTGRVDVAYAEYPFRANENQVCLLVNGEPPMIDVDDPSLVDRKALAAERTYATILERYPGALLFPADRGGPDLPAVRRFRDGGVEFIVDYVLRDGCHACAGVGSVRLRIRFDGDGRLLGTRVFSVRRRG